MTAQLLLVTFVILVGTTARLTRLVTTDTITEGLRDHLDEAIRDAHPTQRAYRDQFEEYRHNVQTALDNGEPVPVEAPAQPDDPTVLYLLHCRWCASVWVALVVTIGARAILSTSLSPLWTALPWGGQDILLIPAVSLAVSYAAGYLADREG